MKFFSGRLYREAFRQIRVIGIILTVCASIIASFIPLFTYIEDRSATSNYINLVNVDSLVSGLAYIAIAVPIILLVKLFGFLFKRSSSDFYHALPYTRQCLYITHLAVALTWCLIILVFSIGLPVVFYSINPHTTFQPEFILYNFVVGLVIMLFVSGAMLIAVSVTGRNLLAVEIAAFIAFLPRVIILIGLSVVSNNTMMIDINQIPFFSMRYSLPMILTVGYELDYAGYMEAFSYAPGIISTLVIGLIYIVLGCILFSIRRSETAENSAPNRKVQLILRTVYSSIFFIGGVSCMLVDADEEVSIILLGIGVIVYLGYELITTRKLKNLVKAIPGLAVSVVLCVAYAGTVNLCSSNILENVPEAGDIESVSLASNYSSWWDVTTYNNLLMNDVVISDKEVSNIIAKSYAMTAEKVSAGELNEYDGDYQYDIFRINYTNGKSKVRVIYMTQADYLDLQAAFMEQEDYYKATYAIPDEVVIGDFSTPEYNENLWKQFKAEYNTLTEKEKDKVLYNGGNGHYYDEYYYYDDYYYEEGTEEADLGDYVLLYVDGYYGTQQFAQGYCVYETLMPKTYKLYYEYQYKENFAAVSEIINLMNNGGIENGDINLWSVNTISSDDYYLESFDLYFYYEDGEVSNCSLYAAWDDMDAETEKGDAELEDGKEVATEGDADEYEDEYYEKYYGAASYISMTLSEEEGLKIANMFLDCYDYKNIVDTSEYYASFYISKYLEDGLDSTYSDGSLDSNINMDKFDELVEYLEANYSEEKMEY